MTTTKFLIAGLPKSGTSYFQQCLSEHPEINMLSGEPELGLDIHLPASLFFNFESDGVRGAKRATYFFADDFEEWLSSTGAMVFLLVRDPIDRLLSHYMHLATIGIIADADINDVIKSKLNEPASNDRSDVLLPYGSFVSRLESLHAGSRSRIKIVLYEDLADNAPQVFRTVFDLLGVDSNFDPISVGRKVLPGFYNDSRRKMHRSVAGWAYKIDEKGIHPKNRNLLENLGHKGFTFMDHVLLRHLFVDQKPIIAADLIQELRQHYKEEYSLTCGSPQLAKQLLLSAAFQKSARGLVNSTIFPRFE